MLVLQHLIARLNWFVIFAKLKPFYKISSNFLSLWRIISSYCCYLPMNLPHSLFKTLVYFLKFIIGKNARLICMIYILYFCALITKVRCPSFFLTASATWPVPSIADTSQCHIYYIGSPYYLLEMHHLMLIYIKLHLPHVCLFHQWVHIFMKCSTNTSYYGPTF